jgi:SAM-dependent methyltransferase
MKICELGCGTGGNLAAVAERHDVVGVECSPLALEYARRRLGNRVIRGSLPNDISLPANSFDVVLLTDVLEHIEDDTASARMALRLLRPGGIVVATVPAYQWLYSPRDAAHHHFRRYSKSRFHDLWRGGDAKVALLSHYNTLLFPLAALVRMASRFILDRGNSGDLAIPPKFVNNLFAGIMRSEVNVLGRMALPFGLSLIAVIRRSRAMAAQTTRLAA